MFLRDGFTAKGEVNLTRAAIGGNLWCKDATFINDKGDAIDLSLAKIGAGLFIGGLRKFAGRLILTQAQCRTYRDDAASWPEPGKLILDGFTYERFFHCLTDWKTRRDWLRLQNKDHLDSSFRPQPWTQCIKVLRDMGHNYDARRIAIEREKVIGRCTTMRGFRKLWHKFLGITVGYGYRPGYALLWSLSFFLVGWLTFGTAANLGYMAPRDGGVLVSEYWRVGDLPPGFSPFNSFVFALDAYLPVIELGQDDAWQTALKQTRTVGDWSIPLPAPVWFFENGYHRIVYWIEAILGWIFVSLFIAGMSGVMKKE